MLVSEMIGNKTKISVSNSWCSTPWVLESPRLRDSGLSVLGDQVLTLYCLNLKRHVLWADITSRRFKIWFYVFLINEKGRISDRIPLSLDLTNLVYTVRE